MIPEGLGAENKQNKSGVPGATLATVKRLLGGGDAKQEGFIGIVCVVAIDGTEKSGEPDNHRPRRHHS